ncbi:hypothetical protein K438DRAFT_1936897 [Mycena galopus ATCC 62051]|nr:hypothetical protein K438DRAFT_1936897 [Mycena galopus ATCC 62051]
MVLTTPSRRQSRSKQVAPRGYPPSFLPSLPSPRSRTTEEVKKWYDEAEYIRDAPGSDDGAVHTIPEISRVGRYLSVADGSRFFFKGIAYQTPDLKRRLVQTACTADCEDDDEVAGPWRDRRCIGGGPAARIARGVRRSAEGRVRHGQSVVTAREEKRRRGKIDLDFTRGVHHRLRPLRTSRAKKAGSGSVGELARVLGKELADGGGWPPYQRWMWMESQCRAQEVDAPDATDTVAAHGVGNKHAKLVDAVAYLVFTLWRPMWFRGAVCGR